MCRKRPFLTNVTYLSDSYRKTLQSARGLMQAPYRGRYSVVKVQKQFGYAYGFWRNLDSNIDARTRCALKRPKFQSPYILGPYNGKKFGTKMDPHIEPTPQETHFTTICSTSILEVGLWNFRRFYRTKTHVYVEITPKFGGPAQKSFQVCYNIMVSVKRYQSVPRLMSPYAEGVPWKRDFGKIHSVCEKRSFLLNVRFLRDTCHKTLQGTRGLMQASYRGRYSVLKFQKWWG